MTRHPERWLAHLLVAVTAAAIHLQTLAFPLLFDDMWLVVRNAFLRGTAAPLTAFAHHFWYGTPLGAAYYRPLVVASLSLNGHLFGWGPIGFHAVNILLHAVNAALVLSLVERLGAPLPAAILAALLFALHPAAAWPVASVVARVDLLPCLFVLLAWRALAAGARRPGDAWRAAFFFLAALLCKESAAGFLALPFLMLRAPSGVGAPRQGRWRAALCCTFALAPYLALRLAAGAGWGVRPSQIDPLTNPLAAMPLPGRIPAALALDSRYLLYLLLPARFHDPAAYGPAGIPPGWNSPPLLGGVLLLGAWTGAILLLWLRRDRLALPLAFSLAAFLPAANLLVPVGSLYALNFLYMPLAGLSIAAGDLAGRFLERRSRAPAPASNGSVAAPTSGPGPARAARLPAPAVAAAAAVLALLGALAFREARIWGDSLALFTAWTERFPNHAFAWSGLGVARLDAGDPAGAEADLRKSLALVERNADAHYNLGVAILFGATAGGAAGGAAAPPRERMEEAVRHSQRASEVDPLLVQGRVNASKGLLMLDRPVEAEAEARAALLLVPDLAPARMNLAESLLRQKRYGEALPLYRSLSEQFPGDPAFRSPWVVALLDAGDLEEARRATEAARTDFPDLAWFDFCLARIEARSGRHAEAMALLEKARRRDPATDDWIRRADEFKDLP